jgi:DNA-binding response OmpR family regulator
LSKTPGDYLLYIEYMAAHDYHTTEHLSILIVDDDGPTLELYANALKTRYHVITCSSWQDTLTILAAQKVELVVIEPAVAGYRLWDAIDELISTYGLSVVICSALEDRRFGLAAGALAYLVKPVLPSVLLETLKSILN